MRNRKIAYLFLMFCFYLCHEAIAQTRDTYYENNLSDSLINQNDTLTIGSDFKQKVEAVNKGEDYKYLRAYKNKKDALLTQNEKILGKYQDRISYLSYSVNSKNSDFRYFQSLIDEAEVALAGTKFDPRDPAFSKLVGYDIYNPRDIITKDRIESKIFQLKKFQKDRKDDVKKDSLMLVRVQNILGKLNRNKQNIEADIDECIATIDSAIAPEYKNQSFKRQISVAFSILIGILIIAFFLIVYLRSDNTISAILLSDGGLQFVTIFVLIIAIILFGVLDILKSNELSAILSGIAGYILGKNGRLPSNPDTGRVSTSNAVIPTSNKDIEKKATDTCKGEAAA
ncbi:MAG: hypothetical protein ACKVOQ_14615 [Cyclobacteriaceae bacterium]